MSKEKGLGQKIQFYSNNIIKEIKRFFINCIRPLYKSLPITFERSKEKLLKSRILFYINGKSLILYIR